MKVSDRKRKPSYFLRRILISLFYIVLLAWGSVELFGLNNFYTIFLFLLIVAVLYNQLRIKYKKLIFFSLFLLAWGIVELFGFNNFYVIFLFLLTFVILYNQSGLKYKKLILHPLLNYRLSPLRIVVLIRMLLEYRRRLGCYPNLLKPQTFDEKLQVYKLCYRHPLMPLLADKCRVAEYLIEQGYEDLLVKRYAEANSVDQLRFEDMPKSFVVKINNRSGMNFIVKDRFSYDFDSMKKKFLKLMESPYIKVWYGEWHYLPIKPRIIVEEYLEDESGRLIDYKVHCFANKAKYIQVQVGNDTVKIFKQNFYDRNWNNCCFHLNTHPVPVIQEQLKPRILSQMLSIAEELSSPFPYVRIDFYIVNSKLYFGEFTFFPGGGCDLFYPPHWDLVLGQQFPKL